jgi:methylmalonyl-CoA mutase N-terminal domain/subunit
MGGMVSAIESGFVQRQIEDSAYQFQQQVERKERIIVGVNRFQEPETDSPETLRLEAAVEESQKRRLADVRQKRDAHLVNSACARLEQAARGTDNIMPPLLEAMRAYATLGEVCGVLRRVFGEYR